MHSLIDSAALAAVCPMCGHSIPTAAAEVARIVRAELADALPSAPNSRAQLLTTKQACAYTGLSERTVRHLVSTGRLTVKRLGRSLRFRRADLDALALGGDVR